MVRKMNLDGSQLGSGGVGGPRRPRRGAPAPISWALASRRDAQGRVVGLTGSGRDITERRESEMRLAQLSRRLLHLREEEQRRISRELHDSTAQNLSALCINVAT
jgi:signal transduction histidine kinase